MEYIVSVTEQGQISIPIQFRRLLGLEKTRKALVSLEENRLIVQPTQDFLSLKGSLKTNKKISAKKARSEFISYLASKAK